MNGGGEASVPGGGTHRCVGSSMRVALAVWAARTEVAVGKMRHTKP